MILTDYYKGSKDPNTKTRYDVVESTGSYDYFEQNLINKKSPNRGGLSFYLVDRPNSWGNQWERKADKAITKSKSNISSVVMPDPTIMIGYGDVNHTQDTMIIIISPDWKTIEIFIARGQKNNNQNLHILAVDGELNNEIEALRTRAKRFGDTQQCTSDCTNVNCKCHK